MWTKRNVIALIIGAVVVGATIGLVIVLRFPHRLWM